MIITHNNIVFLIVSMISTPVTFSFNDAGELIDIAEQKKSKEYWVSITSMSNGKLNEWLVPKGMDINGYTGYTG